MFALLLYIILLCEVFDFIVICSYNKKMMLSFFLTNKISHYAFTLAEVLIVLGIIGVIAESVIPVVLVGQQEKSTVSAVKDAYSMFSGAYKLAVLNDGIPSNWNLVAASNSNGAKALLAKFSLYLKVIEDCGTATDSVCFAGTGYKRVGGSGSIVIDEDASIAKAKLNNGSAIGFKVVSPDCSDSRGDTLALSSVCGVAYIDVNGHKNPNTVGKDFFLFLITKYGIIPHGTSLDTRFPFDTNCKTARTASATSGDGCTAWVISITI